MVCGGGLGGYGVQGDTERYRERYREKYKKMWYNSDCLDEQNNRALCFFKAAIVPHNQNIVGKAPFISSGLASLAVRLGNGGPASGGLFVMKKYRIEMRDANVIQWGQLKRKVFKRDHYRCMRCDKRFPDGKGLTAHHIIPREDGGETYLENLISLCYSCHDFVESDESLRTPVDIEGSYEDGIIVPYVIKLADVQKAAAEGRDAFQRPAWHSWVYGGVKKVENWQVDMGDAKSPPLQAPIN